MRDEQRWLLFIVLSMAILFGYQAYFMPPPPVPSAPAGAPEARQDAATPESAAAADPGAIASGGQAASQAETTAASNDFSTIVLAYEQDFSLDVKGANIVAWRLPGYARQLGAGDDVDLCENVSPPCVAVGFVGLGAPKEVRQPEGATSLVQIVWPVSGGAFVAELTPQPNSRLDVSFYSEGEPTGIRFEPYVDMSERLEPDPSQYVFTGLRYRRAGSNEKINVGDLGSEYNWEGRFDWVMWDTKYFGRAVLLPGSDMRLRVTTQKMAGDDARGSGMLRAQAFPSMTSGKAVKALNFQVFGGPKELGLLRRVGNDLQSTIDFGWTAFIARPLLTLVHLFYNLFGNYGWAIIGLTILIKLVLYPLTKSSFRSMNAMSKLRPKMEEIQKKYKGDPQRLNQEMLNLYKAEKVNPLGGCLPMLLQIPIFFALYNVLLVSIELRHAPFMFWIDDLASPENLYTLALFGFDLPLRILPLVMGATMVYQQRMTPMTIDPMQQKVLMFMPVLFTGLFYGFPSGLVLYWLVNNVVTILQQLWIKRAMEASPA